MSKQTNREKLLKLQKGELPEPTEEVEIPTLPEVEPSEAQALHATCSICGKALSDPDSVARGMGQICADKIGLLPTGVESLKDYRLSKTVDEIPKGFIRFSKALIEAQTKGISVGTMVKAIGGERMLKPPFSKAFKVVYVGRTRYIDSACLSQLDKLLAPEE